jgi:hypothetical protein
MIWMHIVVNSKLLNFFGLNDLNRKQGVSYEMLSCALFKCFPWPQCLMRTTFQGHKEHVLGLPHSIVGGRH